MKHFLITYFTFGLTFLLFPSCMTEPLDSKNVSGFIMQKEFNAILTGFVESLNPADSTSVFVIIKNVDANAVKVYLVAKKPLRTDFEAIGIPFRTININRTPVYIFTGIEKILYQDTLFWKEHSEIFDDREKQVLGIHETPIIKKELYIYTNPGWRKEAIFDDMIFIGNPRDTLNYKKE